MSLYVMMLRKADGELDLGPSAATDDLNKLAGWIREANHFRRAGETYVPFELKEVVL